MPDQIHILCYLDDNGESRFVTLSADQVDAWIAANPSFLALYQFPMSSDRIRIDKELELEYKMNCRKYGLSKSDLHGIFVQSIPHARFELIGMRTKNTKYKIIMRNVDTGQYVRMGLRYFKSLAPEPVAMPTD